jgi:hypothetical protein
MNNEKDRTVRSLQDKPIRETKRTAAGTERNTGPRSRALKVKTRTKAGGWVTTGA